MLLSLGGHSHAIAKTHLQELLTAIAINLVRVVAWLTEIPRATTRTSAFAALMAPSPAACFP